MNSPCGSNGALPSGSMPNRARTSGGIVPEQRVDLRGRPQVERALGLAGAGVARVFGRQAVGVLGRVESPARVRHLARDIAQRIVGDGGELRVSRRPGAPRGTPARAAPGRRASSRSAAPANRRPRSTDGTRRRRGRASRRRPSPEGCAPPSRRAAAWPVRRHSRSRKNSSAGRGNFGAPPNPPRRLSNAVSNSRTGAASASGPGTADALAGPAAANPRRRSVSRSRGTHDTVADSPARRG